jgi:hypothetical protein
VRGLRKKTIAGAFRPIDLNTVAFAMATLLPEHEKEIDGEMH